MTSRQPAPAARDAAYFDRWYADMACSPARDAIVARTLGLPAQLQSTGLLPWSGLDEVTAALRLAPGRLLVDLGCGRAGYGIEVARRTGADLLGVDFSAVALQQAGTAAHVLPPGRARFQVGTLTATGLPAGAAGAVLCVDAIQFAEPPLAALQECRRVLARGGRLVVTCWEVVDGADDSVPRRLREVHLRRDLTAAGFQEVEVRDESRWREVERTMWEAAVAAPAGPDPALQALQDEGRRSLAGFDGLRRVLATATAP